MERSVCHGTAKLLGGGRTWWAHFDFTRINTTPTILPKKIEDLRVVRAFMRSDGSSVLDVRLVLRTDDAQIP